MCTERKATGLFVLADFLCDNGVNTTKSTYRFTSVLRVHIVCNTRLASKSKISKQGTNCSEWLAGISNIFMFMMLGVKRLQVGKQNIESYGAVLYMFLKCCLLHIKGGLW